MTTVIDLSPGEEVLCTWETNDGSSTQIKPALFVLGKLLKKQMPQL
jgi:hypothetical protein